MSKYYLLFTISLSLIGCKNYSPALEDYEKDFLKAANSDLTEEALDSLFLKHTNLIFPQQGTTQLMNDLQGVKTEYSPLIPLRQRSAYKENIEKLLNSKNPMHRILAYITIGSSADNSYDKILLERLKTETNEGCLTWAAMCLFYNHSKSTDQLFEFLVNHEQFGDAHFIPLYLQLDQDSLILTSRKNINSRNKKAQIISLQTLSAVDKSGSADSLIVQAIKTWDIDFKGYAISALFQRDHLQKLAILKPYLENQITRKVSIQVLEKSKFQSDRDGIEKLKNENGWN